MIVRLMGEGQFRLSDEAIEVLRDLDDRAVAALEREDETELDLYIDQMWELVKRDGTALAAEDLHPSDVVIPPADLTLAETRQLFSEDGLVPDIPATD